MEKSTFITLSAVGLTLFVVIIGTLGIKLQDRDRITEKTVGTYATGNFSDSKYIVLDMEGKAYHYKQYDMMFKGTYEDLEDTVYIENEEEKHALVHVDQKLYMYEEGDDEVICYEKITDTPTFMNVNP
ncbi:MAG: hypothetical protein K6F37_08355 [Lachnospiraceae bacterium]|nr:hypothetical protein [Lachnospiraceae bacterium]